MYAKIIENEIVFPPKNIPERGILNYDSNTELLTEDGYKFYIPAEIPQTNRYYHFKYTETEVITQFVVYDETQEEADRRELNDAKENKRFEALEKANDFEENGTVEYKNCVFEMSLSNRQNLKDTQEALIALGQETTPWNDKNDEIVELTLEDIIYIRLNLILARIKTLWIEQYPAYKAQIELAQTVQEVNAIEIEYN